MHRLRALGLVGISMLILPLATGVADAGSSALDDAGRQQIGALIERYRTAWLANDAVTIRSLFVDDAVFLPHHGIEPIVGLEALSAFWWPPKGPEVQIVRFDLETRRIEGTNELAYAWGRQTLEWTQQGATGRERVRTRGNHLTVLRKTQAGWKIALQAGDDEPNERY
jgi:uncharacterized protein (TIGR02246 family)